MQPRLANCYPMRRNISIAHENCYFKKKSKERKRQWEENHRT